MSDPWTVLLLLGLGGLSPSAAILVVRHRESQRWVNDLESYRLRFPGDLEPSSIEHFLGGLSGIRATRWRHPITVRGVGFEIVATAKGIDHYLLIPGSQREIVLSHLRAALPNVGITPDPNPRPILSRLAGELITSKHHHQLRVDDAGAVSLAILAALQPLADDESVKVQWLVFPLGISGPPNPSGGTVAHSVLKAIGIDITKAAPTEPSKAVREKYSAAMFMVTGRLGATGESVARDRQLLARLTGAFHAANSADATLRRRTVSSRRVARALDERTPPLLMRTSLLNARELAGLVAWPPTGTSLPGLRVGGTRQLSPSAEITSTGRVVADSTYPGVTRALALSVTDSLGHLHAIGPTSSGKTTLALNLVLQDVAAKRGVVVVEPADLVSDIADRVDPDRDVIILDPCDDERPVGVNLFAGGIEAPELVAEQVLGLFHRLFRSSWGPRTDDILRAALLTLVGLPGMTLCEVPLLLTDTHFRQRVVGRLDDPVGLGPFWAWYENLGEAERTQAIGPVLNKLRAILVRPRLRRVLGQAEPLLDFEDVLANGRTLLVPLSKGLLGEDAAALLGAVVIARLWQATLRRAAIPPAERHPVFLYIDEFQDYVNLPTPMPDVLAQSRKLGVGLVLLHQHLGQLDTDVREAVLANCRSRVIFQTSATDATRLAREVAPYLGPHDLQGLGPHEVVVTLAANGRTAPPATALTRPAPLPLGKAQEVRDRSRERYGRDRAEIDAELRRRHTRPTGTGPIGRQRRSS